MVFFVRSDDRSVDTQIQVIILLIYKKIKNKSNKSLNFFLKILKSKNKNNKKKLSINSQKNKKKLLKKIKKISTTTENQLKSMSQISAGK